MKMKRLEKLLAGAVFRVHLNTATFACQRRGAARTDCRTIRSADTSPTPWYEAG